MPLPEPKETETQEEFLAACIVDPTVTEEYETGEQRIAVCHSIWEQYIKDKEDASDANASEAQASTDSTDSTDSTEDTASK